MDKKIRSILICLLIIASSCSTQGKTLVKRIVGGVELEADEMTYVVGIAKNGRPACTGGIIGDRHVLTVAHCLLDDKKEAVTKAKIEIIANSRSLLETNDVARVDIEVDEVYLTITNCGQHWTPSPDLSGDIAVLKLKENLSEKLGRNSQILQLPVADKYNTFLHSVADVAGYGASRFEMKIKPPDNRPRLVPIKDLKLLKSKAYVIRNDMCTHFYRPYGMRLNDHHMCVRLMNHPFESGVPQGTCKADSGAPLVVDNGMVIGIAQGNLPTSNCDTNVAPDFFTRVTSYLDFIVNAMEGRKRTYIYAKKVNH